MEIQDDTHQEPEISPSVASQLNSNTFNQYNLYNMCTFFYV